jgi:hypothetical protein
MLHTHCGVELSRKGNLVRATGLDQAITAATSNKKMRKSEPWLRRLFATPTIRYMVEFNHLPDKPVKVGGKWKQTDALDNGLQAESEYTFRGWQWHNDHKCALIEFDGTITTAKEKNKGSVQDGRFYGRYWFNPDAGITTDSIVREEYTWNRGKGPDGEKLPTTQTISVKLDEVSSPTKSVASN